MKKLLCIAVLIFAFTSCEQDDDVNTAQQVAPAKVLGTWELYRDENLESVIDEWTGTEWTTVDQWFQNTREDSQIILEFKADGTFVDRYADVETANGIWKEMEDGRFYFDYNNPSDNQLLRTFITIHCDNTYSLVRDGDNRRIEYYRIIDTIECGDLITYNVE